MGLAGVFNRRETSGLTFYLKASVNALVFAGVNMVTQVDLFSLPDRFEGLERKAKQQLNSIIVSVDSALGVLDSIYSEMRASGRGAFWVLRADSGSGKSTFLHTLKLFRDSTSTTSIPLEQDIRKFLARNHDPKAALQVFVLEEREAIRSFEDKELETSLHAINGFLRSEKGENSLIVWPCNADDLRDRVVKIAREIGGDALLGIGSPSYRFPGPDKSQFKLIADRTISVLNNGATLSDLGISDDDFDLVKGQSETIGALLNAVRRKAIENTGRVQALLKKEECRLWILVAAGGDSEKDVAALTKGESASLDIARCLTATDANVIKELRKFPDKLGILAAVLDAKILHLPELAAMDIARAYADEALKRKMAQASLSLKPSDAKKAQERLKNTELFRLLTAAPRGNLRKGKKRGSNTQEAFEKLTRIASDNDVALNACLARALEAGSAITAFETERDLNASLVRKSDIYCETRMGAVRVEVMWRAKSRRAEIANYALTKLNNYGRAIGFLD